MNKHAFLILAGLAVIAGPVAAQQNYQRRANLTSNGVSDRGKCTIEVVVDGVAEIEIRGDSGTMRNLSGQPPQWRRFECSGVLPSNPSDFRFAGVDGRGRQELIRDPRNGGSAVVRIEDQQGGAEGYTFDITWGGGGGPPNGRDIIRQDDPRIRQDDPRIRQDDPNFRPPIARDPRDRPSVGQFSRGDALRVCEDSVRQESFDRFNTRNVAVRVTDAQDNPGRRDMVAGFVDVRRGPRMDKYQFTCAVNFDTGRVLSVRIDPIQQGRPGPYAGRDRSAETLQGCQRAVEERLGRDGYARAEFTSINVDNRPGRNDWIVGTARAGRDSFNFSCSVNLDNGVIRSVDVTRR
jgi:hypothetical protein